jgi:1-acyl-sn-glycerol-3-phosphate acyltransferase
MNLEDLTKTQLLEIARRRNVRGRSRMTKQQLLAALEEAPPQPPAAVATPQDRRELLNRRLNSFVDHAVSCNWRGAEGHPCGLPVIRNQERCALHGGLGDSDLAIPATGRLGFDTWPTVLRQLWLATYDVDPIGLDPIVSEIVWHLLNYLYFEYFRVEVEGVSNIPDSGPVLLVANHGGAALPYDAAMLTLSVTNEMAAPRRPRIMATEVFNATPTLSHLYRKIGGVYASRGDADYLLRTGRVVGVFPEGVRAFQKPFSQAYHVQRFGRGGFITMAERHGAPVVPVAIVGSDEVHPAVFSSELLARLVRLIWPSQRVEEMAVYLNLIPLPIRWRIRFLDPVTPTHSGSDPDPLEMLERTQEIRETIQQNLYELLAQRGSAI